MTRSYRLLLAVFVPLGFSAGALSGCLDANELTTRDLGVTPSSEFVDVGIPLDPRTAPDGGNPSSDASGGDADAGGTPDAEVITECDEERACAAPLLCVDGVCVPECEADADCGDGFLCRALECIEQECSGAGDCDLLAEVCDAGLCEPNPCSLQLFTYDPGTTTPGTVHVAGDFNATDDVWPGTIAAGGWALEYLAEENLWWGKFEVPNGTYEYKLVLNETEYITDPANPNSVPDPFGGANSLLTVSCSDTGEGGACGDLEAFDWRDTVMYFAMVDRFYDSDGVSDPVAGATEGDPFNGPSGQYEGGDLQGLVEQMGYLEDLGVTAIWITAPYENRDTAGDAINPAADPNRYSGYHGYWPSPPNTDFSDPSNPTPRPRVESRIGTEQDLRDFVAAAHGAEGATGHGIKVLFDYVMNHVDIESPLYQAHPDWFARRDNGQIALCGPENLWDDPFWGTRCAFTDYLPPFDFDNAAARAWSVADAVWWAEEFGIDGYRLDAIKHVPLSWLREVRAALSEAIEAPAGDRFYLVGETFAYDDAALIRSFVDPDTLLDGQFDFPLKARLCEALFRPEGSLQNFAGWMASNDTFYGDGAIMTTWIGNHDIPRPIHFASREIGNCREGSSPSNGWTSSFNQPSDPAAYERLGLSFVVMMTNPGIPLIYYGDEIGLAGGGDPDNRRMMPWDDNELSSAQRSLREQVRALGQIRADNPVLARGRRITRSSSQDTWVYSMIGCGEGSPDVTVAVNRADAERSVTIPAGSYTDLIGGSAVQGGPVSLGPRGYLVLRRDG